MIWRTDNKRKIAKNSKFSCLCQTNMKTKIAFIRKSGDYNTEVVGRQCNIRRTSVAHVTQADSLTGHIKDGT